MCIYSQIRVFLEKDYEKYGNPLMKPNAKEPPLRRHLLVDPFQDLVDRIVDMPHESLQGLAMEAMNPKKNKVAARRNRKRVRTA